MTTERPEALDELVPAVEMVEVFGTRLAPRPAVAAVVAPALSIPFVLGCWGIAALAQALLPLALLAVSTYWGGRWLDERRGRLYWEPRPAAIETVEVGTWMPSPRHLGWLTKVVAAGIAQDDRPWLRLGDGSQMVAEPPRGEVVTALTRPAPWHGLLDAVPVPERRRPSPEQSDEELRTALRRTFDSLAEAVGDVIDSGEPFDRELVVDLARVLESGMESVRASESMQERLRARAAASAVGTR
ncbi:MAG: hypothetical protein ACLGI2_14365 [Acidimicrobiia bacterium]